MFGRGIKLFNLLGFEIRLDWSWSIMALLVLWSLARGLFPLEVEGLTPGTYWWMAAFGAVGLFLSIILHELGHSIVARSYGIPIRSITLFVFGGVAEMEREPPSAKSEFFMAVMGPVTSFILAGLAFGLRSLIDALGWPVQITVILTYLCWVNLLLGGFNLVPAFPLDGGRIFRSILWAWKKSLALATRIATGVGTAFAFLLLFLGVVSFLYGNFVTGIWWFLLGLFVRNASRGSYQQVLFREGLAGKPVADFVSDQALTVRPSVSLREFVDNYIYRTDSQVFPVVEDGRLLGCVSIMQLKRIPRVEWGSRTVQSIVTPCIDESTVTPETDAVTALSNMSRSRLNRLMVVDKNRFVGVVALKDLLGFLSRRLELEGASS